MGQNYEEKNISLPGLKVHLHNIARGSHLLLNIERPFHPYARLKKFLCTEGFVHHKSVAIVKDQKQIIKESLSLLLNVQQIPNKYYVW